MILLRTQLRIKWQALFSLENNIALFLFEFGTHLSSSSCDLMISNADFSKGKCRTTAHTIMVSSAYRWTEDCMWVPTTFIISQHSPLRYTIHCILKGWRGLIAEHWIWQCTNPNRDSQANATALNGDQQITSLLFVDDMVLLVPSCRDLQHAQQRMKMSSSKSEAMVLHQEMVEGHASHVSHCENALSPCRKNPGHDFNARPSCCKATVPITYTEQPTGAGIYSIVYRYCHRFLDGIRILIYHLEEFVNFTFKIFLLSFVSIGTLPNSKNMIKCGYYGLLGDISPTSLCSWNPK